MSSIIYNTSLIFMIIFAFIYAGYGALVCSNKTFDYDVKDSAIIDDNKIVY